MMINCRCYNSNSWHISLKNMEFRNRRPKKLEWNSVECHSCRFHLVFMCVNACVWFGSVCWWWAYAEHVCTILWISFPCLLFFQRRLAWLGLAWISFSIPFRFSRVPIPFSGNGTFIGYECVITIIRRWVVWCHFYSRYWRMPQPAYTSTRSRNRLSSHSTLQFDLTRTNWFGYYIHTVRICFRLAVINFLSKMRIPHTHIDNRREWDGDTRDGYDDQNTKKKKTEFRE